MKYSQRTGSGAIATLCWFIWLLLLSCTQVSVSFTLKTNVKVSSISNGMVDARARMRSEPFASSSTSPVCVSSTTVFLSSSDQHTQHQRLVHRHNMCGATRLYGSSSSSSSSDGEAVNPYYEGMSPYEILGVPSTADPSAITAAFQALVGKWGPGNVQPTSDEALKKEAGLRMQKIYKAYYILDDAERRKLYDTHGESGVTKKKTEKGERAGKSEAALVNGKPIILPSRGAAVDSSDGDEEGVSGDDIMQSLTGGTGGLSDIFDLFFGGSGSSTKGVESNSIRSLFGGGRGDEDDETEEESSGARSIVTGPRSRLAPRKGGDIQIKAIIPFMTSAFGGNFSTRVMRYQECPTCGGFGTKSGKLPQICNNCEGQGRVTSVQRTSFGMMQSTHTCPKCRGSGQMPEESCPTCSGRGVTKAAVSTEVNILIPPGVAEGNKLRVRGEGNAGARGGDKGDLVLIVDIESHERFTRSGFDVVSEERISYIDAILGKTLVIQSLDGPTEVKVPPGTQPGHKLRLKGKGVPMPGYVAPPSTFSSASSSASTNDTAAAVSDARMSPGYSFVNAMRKGLFSSDSNSHTKSSSNSNNKRGDALVSIKVDIPPVVSSKSKLLLEQLREIEESPTKGFDAAGASAT